MKTPILLICPGRGSYTHETLHYFKKFENTKAASRVSDLVERMNQMRSALSLPTISELDSAPRFCQELHGRGEHISSLIFTCSYADFLNLDQEKYEVVAVFGNSMGWYTALTVAGSLSEDAAFDVVQTMGSMMKEEIIGGQVIYPIVDDDWQLDDSKKRLIKETMDEINAVSQAQVFSSIRLGGYIVLAGNELGLSLLSQKLPKVDHFPARLKGHGAYHTPLLAEHSQKAVHLLSKQLIAAPRLPLIDGRGKIWSPRKTSAIELYDYTFRTQVVGTFDFTKAIAVGLKEFAPQKIVVLGPGNSLGAPVGQILAANRWQGMADKTSFKKRQQENPFLEIAC